MSVLSSLFHSLAEVRFPMGLDLTGVGAIAAAVFGSNVLSDAIKGFMNRKKTDSDAATGLATSMLAWQKTLTERIDLLEKQVAEKDQIITDLKLRVAHLEAKETEAK